VTAAHRRAAAPHRLHPPRLAAAAVLDQTARDRPVSLDPGRGHHFQPGAQGSVGDQCGSVLGVSLGRHRQGEQRPAGALGDGAGGFSGGAGPAWVAGLMDPWGCLVLVAVVLAVVLAVDVNVVDGDVDFGDL